MIRRRTDLAAESRAIWAEDNGRDLAGAEEQTRVADGFTVTTVRITSEAAARELGKPVGSYITIELGAFMRREEDAFRNGARVVADQLRALADTSVPTLVVGLGNPAITPDAVGHHVCRNTLVTRHLRRSAPGSFRVFGDVAVFEAGVLGATGIESADVIKSIVAEIHPQLVIAVDALASRSTERLCRTIQISDSGIVPGSGVGNARRELSRASLSVPVIAIGIPTVVDIGTLLLDCLRDSGLEDLDDMTRRQGHMIVTPRDIDANVRDISKLTGYGISMALHPGITVNDLDMFLS